MAKRLTLAQEEKENRKRYKKIMAEDKRYLKSLNKEAKKHNKAIRKIGWGMTRNNMK